MTHFQSFCLNQANPNFRKSQGGASVICSTALFFQPRNSCERHLFNAKVHNVKQKYTYILKNNMDGQGTVNNYERNKPRAIFLYPDSLDLALPDTDSVFSGVVEKITLIPNFSLKVLSSEMGPAEIRLIR
jgi:hypothetical protein